MSLQLVGSYFRPILLGPGNQGDVLIMYCRVGDTHIAIARGSTHDIREVEHMWFYRIEGPNHQGTNIASQMRPESIDNRETRDKRETDINTSRRRVQNTGRWEESFNCVRYAPYTIQYH